MTVRVRLRAAAGCKAPVSARAAEILRGLRGQFHEEGTYPGITDLMSQLAVTGFAPVDRFAPSGCPSSTSQPGGVTYQDTVIGLPADACGFGRRRRRAVTDVVAASACTRPGWSQRPR